MTCQKQLKNSLSFELWTAFINQNTPFGKTSQYSILKLKTITAVMEGIIVTWDFNALSVTGIFLRFLMEIIKRKSKILKRSHFDFTKLSSAFSKSENSVRN